MEFSLQSIVVALSILFLIVVLYRELIRPGIAFMIVTVVLLLFGVISPKEALSGFANEQLAVIVMLMVVSNTMRKTNLLDRAFQSFFKPTDSRGLFMTKMTGSIGLASALLNNTPLVAMMMPYVYSWSEQKKLAASQFLIPLSYASILGGCVTLIGTSTNLIVNGLAMEYGEESLEIFDFAILGIPALIIGGFYLFAFSKALLPSNKTATEETAAREYFVETHVEPRSKLIGKSVQDASLRNMKGLFLVEIRRKKKDITPVPPDLVLEKGDKLFFAGDPDGVAELAKPSLGLSLPQECQLPEESQARVIELVIAPQSSLIGEIVKNTDFRNRYNGAIMGIHRGEERLKGKIGDIELKGGDVLLVLSGTGFIKRVEASQDFYILSQVKEVHNLSWWKTSIVFAGLLLSILLAATNMVPLFISLVALITVCILLKLLKTREIKENADMNLIVIIALGLALGKGMINSGLAEFLANSGLNLLKPFGGYGLIAGIFIVTNLLSAFMTSKAAVAIVLPVALTIAHDMGLPVEAFILVVAFGGAANFITPIGYQTNLMVYTPGGYSFKDYFRFGLPLTLICLLICILVLNSYYNLN
ncbi:MAG: SLC13 family permease [Bacteroidota bacterium]